MDDDGQLRRSSLLHLPNEYPLLHVARRMIVEVVQTDFAPGYDLRLFCQLGHPVEGRCISQLRLVRMNADGRVHKLILLREQNPAIEIHGPVAIPDRDNRFDPTLSSASNQRLTVGLVAGYFKMSVGIDEH